MRTESGKAVKRPGKSAESLYTACRLCGRYCNVDRTAGTRGYCGEDSRLRIAWAGIHHGEEPVICGAGGSGTIFFSGCTLKCFFCQNHQISRAGAGSSVTPSAFADICITLQENGAENINLVTGTHFIPSIAEGLREAGKRGMSLPVLWNSSGYDTGEDVGLLSEFVDVYLPDLKTLDSDLSADLFGAADYPRIAAASLVKMTESRPLRFRDDSLVSGVIVRHLVLPGLLENTRQVFSWFAGNLADRALLSVMFQYTPSGPDLPGDWSRRITRKEYRAVLEMLDGFGIEEGFLQELPGEDNLLPDFSKPDAFPAELASPLWFHLRDGGE